MLGINLGIWASAWRAPQVGAYVRPDDWLTLPTLSPTDQRFVGLFAVGNHSSNFCALKVTGTGSYIVDWGDGTTPDTVASGVAAYHKYDYSAAALVGSECSRGYRQAIVSVTMASGNMTAITLNVKHNQAGLPTGYTVPWLDVALAGSNITSITTAYESVISRLLEIFTLVSGGSIDLSNFLAGCYALQSVTFPAGFGAALTNVSGFMAGCLALQSITLPAGFGAALTNANNFLYGCSSLQSITLPAGFGALLTSATNFLYNSYALRSVTFPSGFGAILNNADSFMQKCYALQSVTLPAGFGAASTSANNFLYGCSSLQSITLPAGFGAVLTSANSFLYNCYALRSVTFPSGFGSALTNADSFMQSCYALQSVTFPAGFGAALTNVSGFMVGCLSLQSITFPAGFGSVLTNASGLMQNCSSLLEIANLTIPNGATTTNLLTGAASIRRMVNCVIGETFTIAACMSAAELNELYTSLPTVAAETITASGNYGYAASNKTILVGKGWNYT